MSLRAAEEANDQLAVTSVALAVPLVYLRRQRTAVLAKQTAASATAAASTAPPRRLGRGIPAAQAALEQYSAAALRPASNAPPPRRRVTAVYGSIAATPATSNTPTPSLAAATPPSSPTLPEDDGFNIHLYGIKAFGGATAIVLLAAASGVWGVKTYMGVEDVSTYVEAAAANDVLTLDVAPSVCQTHARGTR